MFFTTDNIIFINILKFIILNRELKTDNSGMKVFRQYNLSISGFEATILMQTVRKHLVYDYVPIMERTFRSGTRQSCVAQRSIYVMLRGNEETRSYINRVSSAIRSSLSDRTHKCILIQNAQLQTSFVVVLNSLRPSRQKI